MVAPRQPFATVAFARRAEFIIGMGWLGRNFLQASHHRVARQAADNKCSASRWKSRLRFQEAA